MPHVTFILIVLENLLDSPVDYLFISKDFSMLMGYNTMTEAAQGLSERVNDGVTVICPWGDQGAAAKTKGSQVYSLCVQWPLWYESNGIWSAYSASKSIGVCDTCCEDVDSWSYELHSNSTSRPKEFSRL